MDSVIRKHGIPTQKPYKIKGKTYYPMHSAGGYREEGVASWYGDKFHGKSTASGERYNMYGMSAAHTTLPLGTWVTVRNLENNRKIKIRINDRGPFVSGRIIDLSYTAAKKLGFASKGITKVLVSTRSTEKPEFVKWKNNNKKIRFFVQIAAFKKTQNAQRIFRKLSRKIPAIRLIYNKKTGFFKLRTKYFSSKKEAEKVRTEAFKAGFADSFIVAR